MELPEKQTVAKTAADVVVDQAGGADATTIEAGLALTPANGMCLVRDGTYTVPAAGYVSSGKRLVATGRAAILDLGALVQNVFFEFTFFSDSLVEGFRIICDNVAGQGLARLIHSGSASGNKPKVIFRNVQIGQRNSNACPRTLFTQQSVNNSIVPRVLLEDCDFNNQTQDVEIFDRGTTTNRHEIEFVRTFLNGEFNVSGLLAGKDNEWRFTDSEILIGTGRFVFKGNIFATKTKFIAESAITGSMMETDGESHFTGCRFSGTATRNLELLAGADNSIIASCKFIGGSSEALKTSADNGRIGSSSVGLKVFEAGSANKNWFTDIEVSSTIIGTFSKVNNAFRAVVAPAVGDDINDGVLVGDRWIDTVAKKTYVCISNAAGAADWDQTNTQSLSAFYTGDGTLSQSIIIGFRPKYVRIWIRETVDGTELRIFETTTDIVDDNAAGGSIEMRNDRIRFETNRIISLDANGFTVDDGGSNSNPNTSGVLYNYLAIE